MKRGLLRQSLLALCLGLLWLSACATAPTVQNVAVDGRIAALSADILSLGPGIDPQEAARAAEIAINYPMQLRAQYGVTDTPIVHNMKVNNGLRPRGLCFHWADDLQRRLDQERFATLQLHRAIANSDRLLRIEHSTVLVSAVGRDWDDSLVLDPWRNGGQLYWGQPSDDESYHWLERSQVLRNRR